MLDQGAPAGRRHFTCKFLRVVAHVKCPLSAFRFRKLAQSVCRALGPRHFTCKFPHKAKCISTAQLVESVCRGFGVAFYF